MRARSVTVSRPEFESRLARRASTIVPGTAPRVTVAIAILLASFIPAAPLAADIIEVPGDYPTIQEAIDAAVDGDEVHVATGTYYEAIDFLGKSIRVLGTGSVFIDGSQSTRSVVTFQSGETPEAVLESLTIQNGRGTFWQGTGWDELRGGGILISSGSRPTLRGLLIRHCTSDRGGGVLVTDHSEATLEECIFEYNHTNWHSGGAFRVEDQSNCTLERCSFGRNTGYSGGAIGVLTRGEVSLRDCRFWDNVALEESGGAIYIHQGGRFVCEDSEFTSNVAIFADNTVHGGGAMYIGDATDVLIRNGVFIDNLSSLEGGAVKHRFGSLSIEDSYFERNRTIEEASRGGAVVGEEGVEISSSTFVGNSSTVGGATADELVIMRCSFINNWATSAGGACADASVVEDCDFIENEVVAPDGRGGAVFGPGVNNLGVRRCTFVENSAHYGGALADTGTVQSSLFLRNSARFGGAISLRGTGTWIFSSTFVDNRALSGSACYEEGRFGPRIHSSIIAQREEDAIAPIGALSWIERSLLQCGPSWIVDDSDYVFVGDPTFVDPASGDYSLQAHSPAVDQGDPYPRDAVDRAGDPRWVGSFPDIGAFEYQGQTPEFTLRPPKDSRVGENNHVPFGGASPGERVVVAYSLRTGREKVSICPGVFTDLDAPISLGESVANEFGFGVSRSMTVPRSARGRVMYFQALNLDACEVSNLVSHYWR
ncbi:MAG: right-handed parallel beta-helix repeat-containing protein [Phycisphaerales bacterium]